LLTLDFYILRYIPLRVYFQNYVREQLMKRRDFIASTGATAGALSFGSIANAATIQPHSATFQQIEIAIKGGFGSGFTLRSAQHANGRTIALIEHNENRLQVVSIDLADWSVLRATDM
jgi:hypothetical protein